MEIRKAERKKSKLRLGMCAPAGAGKTYSALLIAQGLGGKIGLIDTEAGSGELYSNLCDYSVITLEPPFSPKRYIEAIKTFEKEKFDVIIIDSLSHAWAGEGGLLDQHGKIADSGKGNSYTAWRTVTPLHNALIEAILQSTSHVIATMRSKTEYVLEADDKGRQVPKKVGMAPVQREGMDYEFTVVFDLSQNHVATVSKDRTSLFDGQIFVPVKETGVKLLKWLVSGKEPELKKEPEPKKEDIKKLKRITIIFSQEITKTGLPKTEYDKARYEYIQKVLKLEKPVTSSKQLTADQIDRLETILVKDPASVGRFVNLCRNQNKKGLKNESAVV